MYFQSINPRPIGMYVPTVDFPINECGKWKQITHNEIFSNKRVVVFSLLGAFNPACSDVYLSRYEELAEHFYAAGIDDIYALSVNDTYVMNAWFYQERIKHVKPIPDGAGTFTSEIGMLMGSCDKGFGVRSRRYAMAVDNGVITQFFCDPERSVDTFEACDADTVLKAMAPNAKVDDGWTLITKPDCMLCASAKTFLADRGVPTQELVVNQQITAAMARTLSGRSSYPMAFYRGQCLGGFDEIKMFYALPDISFMH